jgi:hypothetical protein
MEDFREMESVDLKLQLLSGGSIKVDNIEISPYTLEEVRKYGYSKYMKNLQWLTITVDDFIKSVSDVEKRMILEVERSNFKAFDFYSNLGGQEMLDGLIEALAMILKTDDIRLVKEGVLGVGFVDKGILVENEDGNLVFDEEALDSFETSELIFIHRENFDGIVEAIKILNYLKKPVENEKGENPADDDTKQLLEQMKKNEERIKKIKQREQEENGDDSEFDISDIVSSVTVKSSSTNKFNVWKLTIYQLYDEYARLELIDNYDFSIKAMMAGAGDIKLKHWSSRL